MIRPFVLACLLAAPAARAADPRPLAYVPADAALFLHVDVKATLATDLGKSILAARDAPQIARQLKDLKDYYGIAPEGVRSVTAFWTSFETLFRGRGFGVVVALDKPFDLAAAAKTLWDRAPKGATFEGDGTTLRYAPSRREEIYLDARNPQLLVVLGDLPASHADPRPAGETGNLTDMIAEAGKGAAAFLAVNAADLPDEFTNEANIQPQQKPFLPLLKAKTLAVSGTPGAKAATLKVQVVAKDRAAAAEAEKSLDLGRNLLLLASKEGLKETEKAKDADSKAIRPLIEVAIKLLGDATVAADGDRATATGSLPNDAPLTAAIAGAFGGRLAEKGQDRNNLKQLALGMLNYEGAHNAFPPAATVGRKGAPLLSWRVALLPYIEQEELYKKFKLDEPWDSEHNKKVLADNPMPTVYARPDADRMKVKDTHFQLFAGEGALFEPGRANVRFADVSDGTSNTILIGMAAKAVPWTKPDDMVFDPTKDPRGLLLFEDDVTAVVFADGAVRTLKKTIAEATLKALITRAGGEAVDPDE